MQKIAGAKVRPTFLGCFYGPPKTYKTSTALFIPPELRPVAYLDTDRGAAPRLSLFTREAKLNAKLGVVEKMPNAVGAWMREGIDFFYLDGPNYYEEVMEFTRIAKDYKFVVIDTVRSMAEKFLKECANTQYEGTKKGDVARMKLSSGKETTVHAVQTDYGFAQDRVANVIMALDDSPCHVLVISHERTGEIKDTESVKRIITGPTTVGTAQLDLIPSIVDVVLRFEPRNIKVEGKSVPGVAVRSKNHNFYRAGDRLGIFEDGVPLDPVDLWARVIKMIEVAEEGE